MIQSSTFSFCFQEGTYIVSSTIPILFFPDLFIIVGGFGVAENPTDRWVPRFRSEKNHRVSDTWVPSPLSVRSFPETEASVKRLAYFSPPPPPLHTPPTRLKPSPTSASPLREKKSREKLVPISRAKSSANSSDGGGNGEGAARVALRLLRAPADHAGDLPPQDALLLGSSAAPCPRRLIHTTVPTKIAWD